VNLFDFARRVDLKRIGKRPLEMLARAGAFDVLDPNRRRVFNSLDPLSAYSAAIHDQKTSNQVSLFGEAGDDLPEPRLAGGDDWLPAEKLAEEFKAIGFYLSGHPLDDYMLSLKRKQVLTLDDVTVKAERGACIVKMAGTVSGRQERKSARGNRFAFVQLSDPTGQYEVTMFSDTLEVAREYLDAGSQVVIQAEATMEGDQLKLLGRSVSPIDTAVADVGSAGLRIFLDAPDVIPSVATILQNATRDGVKGGRGPIYFCLMNSDLPGEVELDLGQDFPVNPQIKGALRSLGGVIEVEEI
jgi:DNA polymerase-3 subunit alpha